MFLKDFSEAKVGYCTNLKRHPTLASGSTVRSLT